MEKVVFHELDSASLESIRSLLRPNYLLCVLKTGPTILDDELKLWIETAQLNIEATWMLAFSQITFEDVL